MDDLIRRQDAISVLNAKCKKAFNLTCGEEDCACAEYMALRDLPSAQKKGHWSLQHGRMRTDYIHSGYIPHKNYCSCCEKDSPYDKRWKFCPNCGADMRGEDDG